jgi:hypothetical protein
MARNEAIYGPSYSFCGFSANNLNLAGQFFKTLRQNGGDQTYEIKTDFDRQRVLRLPEEDWT